MTIRRQNVQTGEVEIIEVDAPSFPEPATDQGVNEERRRRIDKGKTFTLSDNTVIPITGRDQDQIVLLASMLKAKALEAAGETGPVMVYRDRDNIVRNLTPAQMIELYTLGTAWIEAKYKRSWDMKDRTGNYPDGIPSDFRDNRHWPE